MKVSPWPSNGATPAESFRMFLMKEHNLFCLVFLSLLLSSSE